MTERTPFAYDVVEYPDQWYPESHPDRLATIATLFGMHPAPTERCRVLELGCGAGWNLMYMAAGLPESAFVGIDIAVRPIKRAKAAAAELGLTNVAFHTLNLAEATESFGAFDYIVAHGVYSWVPAPVRDRLMDVCKSLLAPQGVAYVSYATYPGRYLTRVFREIMLYYCDRFDDPTEKVKHARALLGFLRDAQPGDGPYRRLLESEIKRIGRFPDAFLYHDDLSEVNEPCYFREFVAHAAEHGLQYISEANFHEVQNQNLPEEIVNVWKGLSDDVISYEQYRDFIVFRRFRESLLCHQEVALSRQLDVERLQSFFAAAPARRVSTEVNEEGVRVEQYEGYPEVFVDARSLLIQTALYHLGEQWPRFMAFGELVDAARGQFDPQQPDREATRDADALEIAWLLLKLYGARFLSLNVRRPPVAAEASDHPAASRLARWQSRFKPVVGNLIGGNAQLSNPLDRKLLPLLDGTRDRAALCRELAALADAGALLLSEDASLDEQLDAALHRLAREALLVA